MRHAIVSYPDLALGVECAFPPPPGSLGDRPRRNQRVARVGLGVLVAILVAAGLWQLGRGAYVHVKAEIAQVLLRHAWSRTLAGERAAKPWPWADTWPVARLSVPDRRIDLVVLAGANGRAIAFGPGHVFGTPLPGDAGNSAIGGHRDTHLAFLRDLVPGDELLVERRDGTTRRYRVDWMQVLDKRDTGVLRDEGPTRLTLVTCYPFHAIRSGGDQRFVVSARAVDAGP
ncbi:MAG: class GN sortase [Burkholderiales bacterium]|jgi:sortase A|nr:class GN sortase [Burkholderiales bacterium]